MGLLKRNNKGKQSIKDNAVENVKDVETVSVENTVVETEKVDLEKPTTEVVETEDTVKKDTNAVNKLNTKRRTKNTKKKEVCRVIMAKPSFFVIKKNNETIVVNKKNNYCRGQDILY